MRVLRGEVLQDLLVVAAVHAVAVDLQDDLPGLKTRSRRLPSCNQKQDQRSHGGIKTTVELYTTHGDGLLCKHVI